MVAMYMHTFYHAYLLMQEHNVYIHDYIDTPQRTYP
jgi:hypothetical protein